jgi:flavin reductase (DIM6/NTAB) family NADH-FMN oxidoreductase RutF
VADPSDRTHARLASVDADLYRAVMQHWPSGVTVVTMPTSHGRHGMTASAFTSVSVTPPLVLVVVDKRWRSHDFIAAAGTFCVNILGEDQSALADRFAGRDPTLEDRFAGVATSVSSGGSAVLTAAVAHLDCVGDSQHDAGDHTIYVGRVVEAVVHRHDTPPLLYYARDYALIVPRAPERPPP